MRTLLVATTVVLALSTTAAFARAQPRSAPPQKAEKTEKMTRNADQTFVMNAAKGGLAEVELGKLASQNAASDDVKKFGQRMVDDHGKANEELKTLAQQKNITLSTELDAKNKALRDTLAGLKGERFDREYMRAMLADHRKDVNEFRAESKSGKDPDIKAWAAKTLPTLEEHLKQAQDANRAVGTSGTTKTKKK
jgi:putative membrane protein